MPEPQSVQSDEKLPTSTDVVVIGAGVAGIAAALELSERGKRVVVCEKGIVAGEQSSKNWGWCRQMGRDPCELPLARISLQLWREMRQRIDTETGFRECGIFFACDSEKQMAQREQWHADNTKQHGLTTRVVGADEAMELAPGTALPWKGGLFTPDDGRAEPQLAVPAIAEAARRAGAVILQHCAARSLQRKGGVICGVVTEKGEIACEAVVLAGGTWSRRFCHNENITLPQLTVINCVSRTAPIETPIEHSLMGRKFAIRKRLDGGYTLADNQYNIADIMPDSLRLFRHFVPHLINEWSDIKLRVGKRFVDEARLKRRWQADEISPFEQVRRLQPEPVVKLLDEALASLQDTIPSFEDAQIVERWAGAIDVVPDVVPVISKVDALPGFHLMTGFSGHGFGLGPGAGKLMAEIVCNETPCVDPRPFSYRRFS